MARRDGVQKAKRRGRRWPGEQRWVGHGMLCLESVDRTEGNGWIRLTHVVGSDRIARQEMGPVRMQRGLQET